MSRLGGAAWCTGAAVGACAGVLLGAGAEASPAGIARSVSGTGGSGLGVADLLPLAGFVALAFLLGRADDRGRIGPGPKWAAQSGLLLAAALSCWWRGGGLPSPGPYLLVALMAAFVLQTALQVFDNMDGVLGLVASAAFAALAAARLPAPLAAVAVAGCGASLGFLVWNLPPARLFLGNSGSQAVALLLCLLLLLALVPSGSEPAPPARKLALLFPLAWPLADLLFVTASRAARRLAPWRGGRDHTTHRLARLLGSDSAVAGMVAAVACAGLILAWPLLRWSR